MARTQGTDSTSGDTKTPTCRIRGGLLLQQVADVTHEHVWRRSNVEYYSRKNGTVRLSSILTQLLYKYQGSCWQRPSGRLPSCLARALRERRREAIRHGGRVRRRRHPGLELSDSTKRKLMLPDARGGVRLCARTQFPALQQRVLRGAPLASGALACTRGQCREAFGIRLDFLGACLRLLAPTSAGSKPSMPEPEPTL